MLPVACRLGKALLDYFTGRSAAASNYDDVQAASLADPHEKRREPLALDALRAADPLLTPVLDPFVEGVKQPIIKVRGRGSAPVALDNVHWLPLRGLPAAQRVGWRKACCAAGLTLQQQHPWCRARCRCAGGGGD